jgi:hypothetical protein
MAGALLLNLTAAMSSRSSWRSASTWRREIQQGGRGDAFDAHALDLFGRDGYTPTEASNADKALLGQAVRGALRDAPLRSHGRPAARLRRPSRSSG